MYLEEGMQYERSEGTKPAFSFESFEFSLLQLPVRIKVCKEELHFSWACHFPSWGNGSLFDTLTLPSITCWPCSILQVGQPFGMSQNLGGNLSPFSKVSCFPGCWMAGTLCGRVPDTSGPACENCRLGMLLIEKTMLPEQLRYFFSLVLSSSLVFLCCNRYCTNDLFTFLWDTYEIPLLADEGTKARYS